MQVNKNTLLIFKKPGIENEPSPSPREKWENKEKALKIKGLILLILSHCLWIPTLFEEETSVPKKRDAPLEAHHKVVHIPAMNFSPLPNEGEKLPVSLFISGSSFQIKAHFRGIIGDPLGETGEKAIVEIKKEDLIKVKNHKGAWQIYPRLKNEKKVRARINEIIF